MNRAGSVLAITAAASGVLISASALAAPMVCSIGEKHQLPSGIHMPVDGEQRLCSNRF
jgi:hypothetical protein